MAIRSQIREDVLELLWREYNRTVNYQREKNDITVVMKFDEYLTLWSNHRIKALETRFNRGPGAVDYYMRNRFRPVCGWVARERREKGGTMTVHDAKIMSAQDSKYMFQFKKGDSHDEAAKAAIGAAKRGKKQTPEQIAKRTKARLETMARKKAEREAK